MKTSSIFLSQGCFYHRQYRNSISSLLWNSSHHASLPLPSLSHFLLLFFSTINNQGWGLYYFALLWRCRTIVNMCIICDPFTLLVFSVRLHYESWPRSTFFNRTICDRAFYCSTWLMLSEKPPPSPMRVFRSYAVTSSSPRKASRRMYRGNTWGDGTQGKPGSVSDTFTVACGDMLAHFRGSENRGGIPFEAGSSAMRKSGLQRGGLHLRKILKHTKACACTSSKMWSTHMPANLPRIQIQSLFVHRQPSLPSPMRRNPLWIQHNVYERRSPTD